MHARCGQQDPEPKRPAHVARSSSFIMGKKGSSKRDKDRRTQTTGTLAREQRALRNKSKQHEKRRGKRNNDEDEALFRAQLKADGLRVEVVEGDGNCVFRSLSDQLHGDDSAHVELRAAIVLFEKEQHEHFSHFVEDDESWDDYIERMAQDGEWGGELRIIRLTHCRGILRRGRTLSCFFPLFSQCTLTAFEHHVIVNLLREHGNRGSLTASQGSRRGTPAFGTSL